ncbi:MAG: MutS-related protein, partial [Spirochaetota bacterium]
MNNLLPDNTRRALEWDAVLSLIEHRAVSEPGKECARKISPLSRGEALTRLKMISELKNGLIDGAEPLFDGLSVCCAAARRAAKGSVMSRTEIAAVRTTLICSSRLMSFFSSRSSTMSSCAALASGLPDLSELTALLRKSFTESGELNGEQYPQIGRIEKAILSLRSDIERQLSKMIHSSGLEGALQEKIQSTRNDRYVLLIKANMKSKLKGTVQDISASSATLFVEPEQISGMNDELVFRRAELEREIDRILAELSETTGQYAEEIALHEERAAYFDFLTADAKLSRRLKMGEPVITEECVLQLYRARHPLLQMMIGDDAVANDITLGKDHLCVLITGANTGGKTVLLKTAGLCALMACHGLHIPASPDSRIGIFPRILTDIGDDQSIEKSLST